MECRTDKDRKGRWSWLSNQFKRETATQPPETKPIDAFKAAMEKAQTQYPHAHQAVRLVDLHDFLKALQLTNRQMEAFLETQVVEAFMTDEHHASYNVAGASGDAAWWYTILKNLHAACGPDAARGLYRMCDQWLRDQLDLLESVSLLDLSPQTVNQSACQQHEPRTKPTAGAPKLRKSDERLVESLLQTGLGALKKALRPFTNQPGEPSAATYLKALSDPTVQEVSDQIRTRCEEAAAPWKVMVEVVLQGLDARLQGFALSALLDTVFLLAPHQVDLQAFVRSAFNNSTLPADTSIGLAAVLLKAHPEQADVQQLLGKLWESMSLPDLHVAHLKALKALIREVVRQAHQATPLTREMSLQFGQMMREIEWRIGRCEQEQLMLKRQDERLSKTPV